MRRADKEVKDLDQLEEILRACTAVRIGVLLSPPNRYL